MRFVGWVTALAVLVVAVIAGVIGYNIGIGTNIAASGTAVTPGVYPMMGWGWGFGFFPFLGFFFFIILLVIIFSVIRRAAWGGRRWGGGWGPGYGHHGYWKYGPGPDDAFEAWHRRAHGEPYDTTTTGPGQTPPAQNK